MAWGQVWLVNGPPMPTRPGVSEDDVGRLGVTLGPLLPAAPNRASFLIDATSSSEPQYAAMFRLSSSIELDSGLRELIDLRASQIIGCAFCLDMHWKDARAALRAHRLSGAFSGP